MCYIWRTQQIFLVLTMLLPDRMNVLWTGLQMRSNSERCTEKYNAVQQITRSPTMVVTVNVIHYSNSGILA